MGGIANQPVAPQTLPLPSSIVGLRRHPQHHLSSGSTVKYREKRGGVCGPNRTATCVQFFSRACQTLLSKRYEWFFSFFFFHSCSVVFASFFFVRLSRLLLDRIFCGF